MLRPLRLLQKIEGNKLDILRQNKNVYLEKKDELLNEKKSLDESLKREISLVNNSKELNFSLSSYIAFVRFKHEEIDQKISYLDEQIMKLESQIAEGFAEQKKYEILGDKIQMEIIRKAQKAEQDRVDEANAIKHTRELRNFDE
jgi:hypothetical protein